MIDKIYNNTKGQIRQGNFEMFFEMSIDNYLLANELYKRSCLLQSEKMKIIIDGTEREVVDLKNLDELFEIQNQRTKYEIQSLISLAIFIEGFINEIGITELGSRYFNDNLDKLSVLSKWEVTLRLIYGQGLKKDSQYYESIKSIIKKRNTLVHYKTKELNESNKYSSTSFLIEIRNALDSISYLVNDLKFINEKYHVFTFYGIEKQLKRL